MSESTPESEPVTEDEAYALAVDENEPVGDLDEAEETKRRREIQSEDF
ncbi:hypothetical protein [Xylanimonas sp. McL0601]